MPYVFMLSKEPEGVKKLIIAAKEFVAKVERGEARSKRSYAAFKEALALLGVFDEEDENERK